jgi:hypothetical protein
VLRTTTTPFSFLLLSLSALAPGALAQRDAAPAPVVAAAKRPPFVIEAGETPLPALVDRAAAYLECNIVLSERDLASAPNVPVVRLQAPISTDRDGCLDFLADALYRHGFALTWSNERLRIMEAINLAGPRAREVGNRATPRTEAEVTARPWLRMPVTVTLPLQHVNATIATNALRPFFASTGAPAGGGSLTIGNVGNSTAMIVSGMQDQVAQAIRVVRECDLPAKPELEVPEMHKRVAVIEKRLAAIEARLEELAKTSK